MKDAYRGNKHASKVCMLDKQATITCSACGKHQYRMNTDFVTLSGARKLFAMGGVICRQNYFSTISIIKKQPRNPRKHIGKA